MVSSSSLTAFCYREHNLPPVSLHTDSILPHETTIQQNFSSLIAFILSDHYLPPVAPH